MPNRDAPRMVWGSHDFQDVDFGDSSALTLNMLRAVR